MSDIISTTCRRCPNPHDFRTPSFPTHASYVEKFGRCAGCTFPPLKWLGLIPCDWAKGGSVTSWYDPHQGCWYRGLVRGDGHVFSATAKSGRSIPPTCPDIQATVRDGILHGVDFTGVSYPLG